MSDNHVRCLEWLKRAEAAKAALCEMLIRQKDAEIAILSGGYEQACEDRDALRARVAELEGELAAAKGEMACRYSPFDPGEERDYDKCEHCGDYHMVKRRAAQSREAQK